MAYWSVYVSEEDEALLKKLIEKLAKKNRWSFSQAVTGILMEHLIEEKNKISDDHAWQMETAQSFFEGYSDKDAIYDSL